MQVYERLEQYNDVVKIYMSNDSYCFDDVIDDNCKYKYSDFKNRISCNIRKENGTIIIDSPFRAGSGIVLLVNNEFFVLSYRHPNEYTEPLKVQGFGGHIPFGETWFYSAKRELSEELALVGIKNNGRADFLYFDRIDPKLYGLASVSFDIDESINIADKLEIIECDCTSKYQIYKGDRLIESGNAIMYFDIKRNSIEVLFVANVSIDGYKYLVPLHNEMGGEIGFLLHKNLIKYIDRDYFSEAMIGNLDRIVKCIFNEKCSDKGIVFM